MVNENMKKILEKIKEYNRIIIFRHFRPDGDAIGSTKGLAEILKATYPEKEIYLQNNDFSKHLAFLGGEDEPIPDEMYTDALGIAIDTGTFERLSNPKYKLCREHIKIDHHIPIESYAEYEWVEELRSSSCEMIAAFYDAFKDELRMTDTAAYYIYTGMVTDSGRFRYRDVSGETLRLAGTLLKFNVDAEKLYANLYLREFESFKFESHVHKKMKISENGVASIYISLPMQKEFNLSTEDASAAISHLDSIKGSLIWVAFIECPDGSVRVRLRSRFITINSLAEKYRGGGHACAAGATVYSRREANKLIKEADAMLKEFKENNEGWL